MERVLALAMPMRLAAAAILAAVACASSTAAAHGQLPVPDAVRRRDADGGAVCDVMMHGAKCDDKTDDSSAIQSALDDARCTTVRVPAPHKCVSRSLNISRMSGRTLRIESGAQLVLWRDIWSYADNTNGTVFSFLPVLRLFPPCALISHAQGSSGVVDNMPFAWRGHSMAHTKSLTTRARPSPDLAVRLE